MISIPQEADPVFIGTTHFVMVARNKNGRASAVHPILSKNPEVCTVSAAILPLYHVLHFLIPAVILVQSDLPGRRRAPSQASCTF